MATEVKFLCTADWQWGMTRHFFGADAQAVFDQSRLDAVSSAFTHAATQGCSFAVVAGDMFDDNFIDRKFIERGLRVLTDSPIPVYVLPGNHDPLLGKNIYHSEMWKEKVPAHVHVIESTDPHPITIEGHCIEIVGVPWRSKTAPIPAMQDVLSSPRSPQSSGRILVLHSGVDAFAPLNSAGDSLLTVSALNKALDSTTDFVCLGDRHSATSIGSTGRCWYPGSPETTAFDDKEKDSGTALVVSLQLGKTPSDTRVDVEKFHTGQWEFRAPSFHLNSQEDVDAMCSSLDDGGSKAKIALKLKVTGSLSIHSRVNMDAALDNMSTIYGSFQLPSRHDHVEIFPDELDGHDMGAGYIQRTYEDLSALAMSPGDQASTARRALQQLFVLRKQARS